MVEPGTQVRVYVIHIEKGVDLLNIRFLHKGFHHHLHRFFPSCIKNQDTAGKLLCQMIQQKVHLFDLKIIKHTRGKENDPL